MFWLPIAAIMQQGICLVQSLQKSCKRPKSNKPPGKTTPPQILDRLVQGKASASGKVTEQCPSKSPEGKMAERTVSFYLHPYKNTLRRYIGKFLGLTLSQRKSRRCSVKAKLSSNAAPNALTSLRFPFIGFSGTQGRYE
ncbi:hypothetical protein DdX_10009 [Ditylenchus destructor]|uniref:Uncharacterized protein n=1 Tax=Ditylenchus destructor TaxID=166010 RepID=A0AAD4N1K8_9BILA|nr:hypothetical protein DdX_10009 [Ditylenchus destructor]